MSMAELTAENHENAEAQSSPSSEDGDGTVTDLIENGYDELIEPAVPKPEELLEETSESMDGMDDVESGSS